MFSRQFCVHKCHHLVSTLRHIKQERVACLHVVSGRSELSLKTDNSLPVQRSCLVTVLPVRFTSNSTKSNTELSPMQDLGPPLTAPLQKDFPLTSQDDVPLDPIPELPLSTPTNIIQEIAGEPTFLSLGLGGWSPVGLLQSTFEFFHITCNLPWWSVITLGTVMVRLAMFPIVIYSQKNMCRMNVHLPELQRIQRDLTEARERGDRLDAARSSHEMMLFMKEKKVNPLKNAVVPLAQAPVFISFFWGLRGMANAPVESLKNGGLFWFTDLTIPDQYYLLPCITCVTLLATVELSMNSVGGQITTSRVKLMKYVFRALPVMIFPFIMGFPGAVLMYWTTSNFISLAQVAILKVPSVRKAVGLPPEIVHTPAELGIKDKGFVGNLKEAWTNIKLTSQVQDRERIDHMQFVKAGRGAIKKTYKYNPMLQSKTEAIEAKKAN